MQTQKRIYKKPVLEYCGPVSERTLGGSGPYLDGGPNSKEHGCNMGNDKC